MPRTDEEGRRAFASDYMNFAKLESGARFNLATSGVADCQLTDIGAHPDDLGLHGDNAYGWPPLAEAIAARFGIDPACVVIPGGGASFANHLAMAAVVSPGDEVLIEDPTYELLTSTLSFQQARIVTFQRRFADAWRLDPDDVARRITPRTRLVVTTNLHNPSGAPAVGPELGALARAAGESWLLVDEVYLELTFGDGAVHTAFRDASNVIVTSSLTKAYGLSGLRCGWILAPPALAERMRRLNDLFGVKPPHLTERLSIVALRRLESLRARARSRTEPNRAAYREILGDQPVLDQIVFDHATTVFPRLRLGDGDGFAAQLKARFETSVVPGRFFGRSDHIRIGLGGDPAQTREGLGRVAEALAAWARWPGSEEKKQLSRKA